MLLRLPLPPRPPVVQSRWMSEAFKWGRSAPEAASAATAGLNQKADRAEGGCVGEFMDLPDLLCVCMTGTDYGWQQRWLMVGSVSALMYRLICERVYLQFLTWSVSVLFFSVPPYLTSCWTNTGRTAVAILGHLLFGMLHLPARTASLSLLPSVCLSFLGSASYWLKLALRRQVCSTTLIPHYKKKEAQNTISFIPLPVFQTPPLSSPLPVLQRFCVTAPSKYCL